MKKIPFILLLFMAASAYGQHPSNDYNWDQPDWADEFNTGTRPDSKWMHRFPWGKSYEESEIVWMADDGSNTIIEQEGATSYLSFKIKKEAIQKEVDVVDENNEHSIRLKSFGYSSGHIQTSRSKNDFHYGYYEMRMRLPDDYRHDAYGRYFNASWWLFERREADYNLDHCEIDFFEIDCHGFANTDNRFTCNVHVIKPFDYNKEWEDDDPTVNVNGMYNPARFYLSHTDPNLANGNGSPDERKPYFDEMYRRNYLQFNNSWKVIGCEWLPDQIKFYVDGKLIIRLEGDYQYTYTDIYNAVNTILPIHELALPMPMNIGFNSQGDNVDYNHVPTAPDLSMDMDYVRYYKLKKACSTDPTLIVPNVMNVCQFFSPSLHAVYKTITLGCQNCVHEVDGNNCRVSLRAKDKIQLNDGFKTIGESELYIHDVNCDKLPEN